ncbi:Hypothetical protein LUCI_1038 [Lucifera butyrica]|uniref:Uncharacterized protein n=1 Tax=Lucifera butyrica TaxID=1351585 RepID=A0A498R4T2_9FIRM|nr:Hypothetical protein LUCI_1038 [Lucifera butyrica]
MLKLAVDNAVDIVDSFVDSFRGNLENGVCRCRVI